MNGIVILSSKVIDNALNNISDVLEKHGIEIQSADLRDVKKNQSFVSYEQVNSLLSSLGKIDFAITGDAFWSSGKNICRWCKENHVKSYLFQHGQWIQLQNKKDTDIVPDCVFFLGDDLTRQCSQWADWKYCKAFTTGSPRYDDLNEFKDDGYIYFSPPAVQINDIFKKISNRIDDKAWGWIKSVAAKLKGMKVLVHPHYREMQIKMFKKNFSYLDFINPKEDPLPIIANASKVLTHRNSTTVLDAIACHKSVVLMDTVEEDRAYFKRGHFGEFALESDILDQIQSNLKSDYKEPADYTAKAKKYIYLGNASERIARIVKK